MVILMKKKIIIISIILFLVLTIGGLIFIRYTKINEQKELDSHLVLIDTEKLKEKIDNKDTFMLIITQTECVHCEAYLPTLKKVLFDYDITAYQIHQDTLNNEEKAYLKGIASISGTPTLIFLKDGEEMSALNRLVGEQSRSKTIERLKVMGYIE